ncbi:Fibrocystin-L-like protein [Rhodotorula toruloides]|nr:Fibrocystin-L-like protein [Rhodotorula toruloides]
MDSKGLPAAVQRFAHASDHAHLDHLAPSTSSSSFPSGSTSFRSDASPPAAHAESDFAAFTGGSSGLNGLERSWKEERRETATRNASRDGFEINALLVGNELVTDAVDGDWERDLKEEQARPWRVEMETTMPSDPFASSAALASRSARLDALEGKGKGKARAGDMSPTSADLLSSLSSLDLADKAYLRSLLSLSPDEAFQDYLSRSSYADDVYGLPQGVKRLFEKAAREEEGVQGEEGRTKALRRLDMVLQHLRAAEAGGGGETAVVDGLSTQRQPQTFPSSHPPFTNLASSIPPSFASPTPAQHAAEQSSSPHPSPPRPAHSHYSVPSSLSESAFITIAGSQPRHTTRPVSMASQAAGRGRRRGE